MKSTVNTRITLLKTKLNLGNDEFSYQAGISPGTYWSISNGGNVAPKTIKKICEAFNVNAEWMLSEKGEMFLPEPEKRIGINPWKEEAYVVIKEENSRLAKEIERLWVMIDNFSNGKVNFLTVLKESDLAPTG